MCQRMSGSAFAVGLMQSLYSLMQAWACYHSNLRALSQTHHAFFARSSGQWCWARCLTVWVSAGRFSFQQCKNVLAGLRKLRKDSAGELVQLLRISAGLRARCVLAERAYLGSTRLLVAS